MLVGIRDVSRAWWLAAVCLAAIGCEERASESASLEPAPEESVDQATPQPQGATPQAQQEPQIAQTETPQPGETPNTPAPAAESQTGQAQTGQEASAPQGQLARNEATQNEAATPQDESQQAQTDQTQTDQAQTEQGQLAQQEQTTESAHLIQGTMRGTVRAVDLAQGSVTIEGGGQQAALQAHPSDLTDIELGEQVELSFSSYPDGSQWMDTRGDSAEILRTSSSVGQLTGQVEAIDADAGVVAIGGQTFRAHPQQLQDVSSGESVTLSYAEVEDTAWVAELESAQAGAVASAEQAASPEPQAGESDIDWIFQTPG